MLCPEDSISEHSLASSGFSTLPSSPHMHPVTEGIRMIPCTASTQTCLFSAFSIIISFHINYYLQLQNAFLTTFGRIFPLGNKMYLNWKENKIIVGEINPMGKTKCKSLPIIGKTFQSNKCSQDNLTLQSKIFSIMYLFQIIEYRKHFTLIPFMCRDMNYSMLENVWWH